MGISARDTERLLRTIGMEYTAPNGPNRVRRETNEQGANRRVG